MAGPFNKSTPTNIIPKSKTPVATLQTVKLPSSFTNNLNLDDHEKNRKIEIDGGGKARTNKEAIERHKGG